MSIEAVIAEAHYMSKQVSWIEQLIELDRTDHDFSSDGQKPVTLTEFILEVEDILFREDFL